MADARYRRRAGEAEFGFSCPECAEPKSLQASRCRSCYAESLRKPDPVCECGRSKSRTAKKCLRCEHERRRANPGLFDFSQPERSEHPWARSFA
jgi:hypothetical protein